MMRKPRMMNDLKHDVHSQLNADEYVNVVYGAANRSAYVIVGESAYWGIKSVALRKQVKQTTTTCCD